MNKREVASLACKILGIYTIVQGINATISVLSYSLANPNQMGVETIFSFIFLFVFGLILWFLAERISDVIFKEETCESNESSRIKASELQNVAFSVLGLYFIGNSIPRLFSFITSFYTMNGAPNSTKILLLGGSGVVAQFLIGVGIFLGSRGLVNFLNTIRRAGLNKNNTYEEEKE